MILVDATSGRRLRAEFTRERCESRVAVRVVPHPRRLAAAATFEQDRRATSRSSIATFPRTCGHRRERHSTFARRRPSSARVYNAIERARFGRVSRIFVSTEFECAAAAKRQHDNKQRREGTASRRSRRSRETIRTALSLWDFSLADIIDSGDESTVTTKGPIHCRGEPALHPRRAGPEEGS